MRQVVLDTETTGLDPRSGDRVVEIGCVELTNHVPTGETFHRYVNPERDMPEGARAVHGLTSEFLSHHPTFVRVADEFLAFINDSELVIHNAEFDMRFINAELKRLGREPLSLERTLDTVAMARRKYPGAQASLDALCRRFNIDTSARAVHGALTDARLLAEVFLKLVGGRQPGLALVRSEVASPAPVVEAGGRERRRHEPTAEEAEAHERFLQKIASPIWRA
jgi:DNA polymerase-3 subunit epsilon